MQEAGNTNIVAGTMEMAAVRSGEENEERAWGRRHGTPDPGRAQGGTEVTGLVVLYTRPAYAGGTGGPATCGGKSGPEYPPEFSGDLIFSMYERQERIADRLNNKIKRLEQRLRALEERGRQ